MFEAKLDRIKPRWSVSTRGLVLASNGLDENSANDMAILQATSYTRPGARYHNTDAGPRTTRGQPRAGSTRKKDEVDVMWALARLRPFDREQVGSVALARKRTGRVGCRKPSRSPVGGDGRGGRVRQERGNLRGSGRRRPYSLRAQGLEALRTFGERGATATEWEKAARKSSLADGLSTMHGEHYCKNGFAGKKTDTGR